MKYLSAVILLWVVFSSCSVHNLHKLEKIQYATSRDEGHEGNAKILKGIINRSLLETDTAFKWFADNYKYAAPDENAVNAFTKNKDKFIVLVFGGTWCHDTQNLLPLFYKLTDKSNFPQQSTYLAGVDRAKTTSYQLHKKYNITNVPTFIVIEKATSKEVGRVVEYGKTGAIDKELGEIVSKM